MANGNNVDLIGNVTRDPELRFTPSGQAVATFGLAVNRRWQNRQTQAWEESTSFFDVVCWAQLAENVAESVTKGTRLMVIGRLDQRSWETQDGDKRSKVEVDRRRGRTEPPLGDRQCVPQRAQGRLVRRRRQWWRWWLQPEHPDPQRTRPHL